METDAERRPSDGSESKGPIMVPRSRGARTSQTLPRSREPLWSRVTIFGRRRLCPCGERKEGPQGRKGVRNSLALCEHGTVISPLEGHCRYSMLSYNHRHMDQYIKKITQTYPSLIELIFEEN